MPQVSTRSAALGVGEGEGVAAARMASTKPAISAGVSPRVARELRRAAMSRSVSSPRRMVCRGLRAASRG